LEFKNIKMEIKNKLINDLKTIEELKDFDLNNLIEKPKKKEMGDFSLPVFIISKKYSKNPNEIAKILEEKINLKNLKYLEEIKAIGPFLNFKLNYNNISKNIFNEIINENFKNIKISNKKILIEYPSPNTNKSLHVGHVRNILLGNSLKNILKRTGYNVIHTNLNNDRGISICQAMLSYQKYGENKTPKEESIKPDKFVEKYYILYNQKLKENPDLEKEALEMLEKWENGDKETLNLWKKLLKWVYEGYKITFKNYKLTNINKEYFESQIFDKGKEIVLDAIDKKVPGFKKEKDGAIYFDFEDKTYGKKYLLRPNGTTLYMTQDIYLAKLKEEEFKADKFIFIVAKEQNYHFEVLFKLLEILNISKKEQNYHFAYGYVFDKDGKKFSSRYGNSFGADELLDLIEKKAFENLKNKELTKNLNENELIKRSKIIGFAALSFSFLKVNPLDDMKFDIDKALQFEGETGPYILYTYARIKSIIRKSNFTEKEIINKIENTTKEINFNEKEKELISIINEYNEILKEAALKFKISAIPNYLIKLSKEFNNYYQNTKILEGKEEEILKKLILIYSISIIIKDALSLLNIETLEEM
jgi:arginyl-tRNA synthetase